MAKPMNKRQKMGIKYRPERLFSTISEVSELLNVPKHSLRNWEKQIEEFAPMRNGNRRYYRYQDVLMAQFIASRIKLKGYTLNAVQIEIRNLGAKKILHQAGMDVGKITGLNLKQAGLDSEDQEQLAAAALYQHMKELRRKVIKAKEVLAKNPNGAKKT